MLQPLFIETIRLFNGRLCHLSYHNRRFNQTRRAHFEVRQAEDLQQLISIPDTIHEGLFKCRVIYGRQLESVTFEPYAPRLIQRLRLVNDDTIRYDFKYLDRSRLNELFAERESADDILIVKNGLITDASYANVVFRAADRWVTPAEPLLPGTQRARLLDEGIIYQEKIKAQDLPKFSCARLINAMLDFESTPPIKTEHIEY